MGSCALSSFHWISALSSHKTGGMGRSLADQERQQRLLQQSWGRENKILVLSVTLTRGLGCLVSFGEALRLLQPGLATSRGSKNLPPSLRSKWLLSGGAAWRANLPDGEPGVLGVSLQAGEGRGSSEGQILFQGSLVWVQRWNCRKSYFLAWRLLVRTAQ